MNATVSVDTTYNLRLAQSKKKRKKNEEREARRFSHLHVHTYSFVQLLLYELNAENTQNCSKWGRAVMHQV